MRNRVTTILTILALSIPIFAQKVTFMPQWTPQSQFAGYYVALKKGFYTEEGLDVEIKHLSVNSTETATDYLLRDEVQITGMQLIQAMIARSNNTPLVNIFQLAQRTGLMCVSHTPIFAPSDLTNMKVGRWKAGYSDICEIINTQIDSKINWVPFINGINLFIYKAVDATLCYSYSEYIQLLQALGRIDQKNVIRYYDFGYTIPEDGLYVTEQYYSRNKQTIDKFVRATKRGWDYTRENIDEALEITKSYTDAANIITNDNFQRLMLEEYLRLQVNPRTNKPDYSPIDEHEFNKMIDDIFESGHIVKKINYKDVIK